MPAMEKDCQERDCFKHNETKAAVARNPTCQWGEGDGAMSAYAEYATEYARREYRRKSPKERLK